MKKRFKYLIVIIIFIFGLSLGRIESKEGEMVSVDDVKENIFMKTGNFGEKVIVKMFDGTIDICSKGLKIIFGL